MAGSPTAPIHLICLPFAGGGASLFRQWGQWAPDYIEVHAPRLPGREGLLNTPAIGDMEEMITWLEAETADLCKGSFALFGHSMGAAISYAFALERQKKGLSQPEHLFLSGCKPLPLMTPDPLHLMPPERMQAFMRDYDPGRDPFGDYPELWSIFEPTLRADFRLIETYVPPQHDRVVHCSITALSAERDIIAPPAHMSAWKSRTSCAFSHVTLPGEHLFLRDDPQGVFALVRQHLHPGVENG